MPVIDEVSADYPDVAFVAIAGRSTPEKTAAKAGEFVQRIPWGYDDAIWELYGIPGQPASVLIADGVVVDGWFGAVPEE
ncbi:MAG TPA: hypothetical protein ENK55_02650, partial [Actinobacteria bacterium]|nr:hypothetical protein [Actinomycetota bacterium]